jgi:hypothetical protein
VELVAPLRISDQEHGIWPKVCAETGVPTAVTMDLPVRSRPAWPWLLLPISIVLFAFARLVTKEARVAYVAVSPLAWERYRHRVWAEGAVGAAGLALSLAFGGVTLAVVVVVVVLIAGSSGRRSRWVSVNEGDGYYFVAGVHPAYLKAALELDRRGEGA